MRRALILGERHGATVVVLHVIADDRGSRRAQEHSRRACRLLEDWYGPSEKRRALRLHIRVAVGGVARTIADVATLHRADLLVFGGSRRSSMRPALLGSLVETVIGATGLPALVVKRPPLHPYRRILLGAASKESTLRAITAAAELELFDDVDLRIVRAFTTPGPTRVAVADLDATEAADYRARAAVDAHAGVTAFLAGSEAGGLHRAIHVVEGSPDTVVCRAAEAFDTELVVIGASRAALVTRALFGSVAGEIIDRASCDVLAVPPPRLGRGEDVVRAAEAPYPTRCSRAA